MLLANTDHHIFSLHTFFILADQSRLLERTTIFTAFPKSLYPFNILCYALYSFAPSYYLIKSKLKVSVGRNKTSTQIPRGMVQYPIPDMADSRPLVF